MDTKPRQTGVPRYYQKFSCIGPDCENNCCHNWCISIDQKTWDLWQVTQDTYLSDLSRESTHTPDNPTDMDYRRMTMGNDSICPAYRRDDGLCEIHKQLGEDLLSETCRTYPRRLTRTPEGLEPSLSISCPQAARLILLDENAMQMKNQLIESDSIPTTTFHQQPEYFEQFRLSAMTTVSDIDISPDERLYRLGVLLNFVSISQINGEDPSRVFATFETMQQNAIFSRMYQSLPDGITIQAEVLKHLLMAPSYWKINSVLADYHQQFQDILKRDYAVDGNVDLIALIRKGYKKHFQPIASEKSQAFTNFFQHWIYSSDLCYLQGAELMHKYSDFLVQYSIIRTYLSVLAKENGSDELMIGVVHALSRGFDHHPPFLEKLFAYLNHVGLGNPIQMMALLKIESSP
ncbi:flagellin lysine-N-methylase [Sansalvadorimonas sp. 2012CJ34-2]|uniref:Flagellin lysine-N-methylase n=1 Tax=Parendozoicomonas callyspongiae TaxID=2942213 RepID=A0ABT0PLI1_9GAMM|nr:flagellin lysine-N-methylase [Sansalvadorimonas sp. 2012CJ34-2]MCL6271841.1 flagellin lysine-N-methylase [Sansalvadorimonas sp. 2012CJ34-2]